MPEFPTPCTNGQSAPTQGPSSISSFDPAARTLGLVGSTATVGSFCLFCGNGLGGLPVLTNASAAAWATAGAAPKASTTRATTNRPCFNISDLLSRNFSPPGHYRSGQACWDPPEYPVVLI